MPPLLIVLVLPSIRFLVSGRYWWSRPLLAQPLLVWWVRPLLALVGFLVGRQQCSNRRAAAAAAAGICGRSGGSYWQFGFLRRRNSGQSRG